MSAWKETRYFRRLMRTSADFGRLMESDVEKWAGVIQSANIKLEQ
jgi:hypothetical protein